MLLQATAPPDSPWKTPLPGFGIDTVRLRGPATLDLLAELPEKRFKAMYDDETGEVVEAQRSGYTALRVGETLVRVKADLRTGAPEVAVEFSAPSVLNGHNRDPLPVGLLADVVDIVHGVLRQQLTGVPSLSLMRLIRLDVDRDLLGVRSIPHTLWSLAQRPVPRVSVNRLEAIGNTWQTLTRGNPGRWLGVGYGKGEQLALLADRAYDDDRRQLLQQQAEISYGTLRWELQLRREKLRDYGNLRPDALEERMILNMAEQHFERTRFSDVLAGGGEKVHEALAELTNTQQRGVLALLAADLVGLPAPMSHGPEDTYRALARRLRLVPDDLLGQTGDRRRLDFASGLEMVVRSGS